MQATGKDALNAGLGGASDVATDAKGNIFIAAGGRVVEKDVAGALQTFASTRTPRDS